MSYKDHDEMNGETSREKNAVMIDLPPTPSNREEAQPSQMKVMGTVVFYLIAALVMTMANKVSRCRE